MTMSQLIFIMYLNLGMRECYVMERELIAGMMNELLYTRDAARVGYMPSASSTDTADQNNCQLTDTLPISEMASSMQMLAPGRNVSNPHMHRIQRYIRTYTVVLCYLL